MLLAENQTFCPPKIFRLATLLICPDEIAILWRLFMPSWCSRCQAKFLTWSGISRDGTSTFVGKNLPPVLHTLFRNGYASTLSTNEKLWRHKLRTPNTNYHHMLNETTLGHIFIIHFCYMIFIFIIHFCYIILYFVFIIIFITLLGMTLSG